MNQDKTLQFIYADRELIIQVCDLLTAPVDVIVNAANSRLSHGGGIAGLIVDRGGDIIQQESDQFIVEHGFLETGMVAMTSAGNLPFKALLHAVGPRMGDGNEQYSLQQAIARCLQMCEMHDWSSIGFPAISSGIFGVPVEITARAFFMAISSYWDARMAGAPERIMICLTEDKFSPFVDAFRSAATSPDTASKENSHHDVEPETGVFELNEQELVEQNNSDIEDWFK